MDVFSAFQVLLFLVPVLACMDLLVTSVLVAVTSSSPVAMERMVRELGAESTWLLALSRSASPERLGLFLLRQVILVSLTVSAVVLLGEFAVPAIPWIAWAGAVLLGVLAVEMMLGHLAAVRHPRMVLRLASLILGPFIRLAAWVAFPMAALLQRSARSRTEGEGGDNGREEEEAEALIRVAEREGLLEADESRMIRSIVELDEILVREVMTPRTDIVALPATFTVRQATRELSRGAHSRIPVYRKSIDDVVGILHVRDLLQPWAEDKPDTPIPSLARPALFVPETLTVRELLAEMRTRTHIAMVVDEFGGIAGLVTIEDLVEEIVGEIRDEHDKEDELVRREADGSWLVSGLAHVKQLETLFEFEPDEEREYDTVGGMVLSRLGRVPKQGEVVSINGLRIEVVQADRTRVHRLRIWKDPEAEAEENGREHPSV